MTSVALRNTCSLRLLTSLTPLIHFHSLSLDFWAHYWFMVFITELFSGIQLEKFYRSFVQEGRIGSEDHFRISF